MSVTPHHIAPPQASTGPPTSVYSRGHPYPQYNLGLNPATVSGPGKQCLIVVSISRFAETKAFNLSDCSSFFLTRPTVLTKKSQLRGFSVPLTYLVVGTVACVLILSIYRGGKATAGLVAV